MAENRIGNNRPVVGIAQIAIPGKVDRDAFVADCSNLEQVFILTADGEFIHDVFISKDLMNWIEFPEDDRGLGSTVVYVNYAEHNKPIIVAVLSSQSDRGFIGEGQFSMFRSFGNNSVGITGDAKSGSIGISVNGEGAKIRLKSLGKQSEITVSSQGVVNVIGGGVLTVRSLLKRIVLNEGEFGGLVKAEELSAGLGKTNSYLETLKSATKAIAVALDALVPGTSAAFDAAMAAEVVGDFSGIENEEVKH